MNLSAYFDLRVPPAPSPPVRAATAGAFAASLAQYAAVLLGVVAQPFFDAFGTGTTMPTSPLWQLAGFSLVVTTLIFPGIYRSAWNANQPRFVQYCTIFASGVGWQSLIEGVVGAAKAAGGNG
jgi:hypothetical protein